MIEIDKNVPIPPKAITRGRRSKYPFRAMEVGDSFFVPHPPGLERDFQDQQRSLTALAGYWRKTFKSQRRWHVARVDRGIRVWRTE